MDKHYLNLTDGLEWADRLTVPYSFIRIESTAIEKNDWVRLMRDLDVDLLMNLALGNTCHIYDCGTRRPTSKTISMGIPYIRHELYNWWFGDKFYRAETLLQRQMKRKLSYFRRFLATDEIRLVGHSFATDHDGDVNFYRAVLGKHHFDILSIA